MKRKSLLCTLCKNWNWNFSCHNLPFHIIKLNLWCPSIVYNSFSHHWLLLVLYNIHQDVHAQAVSVNFYIILSCIKLVHIYRGPNIQAVLFCPSLAFCNVLPWRQKKTSLGTVLGFMTHAVLHPQRGRVTGASGKWWQRGRGWGEKSSFLPLSRPPHPLPSFAACPSYLPAPRSAPGSPRWWSSQHETFLSAVFYAIM